MRSFILVMALQALAGGAAAQTVYKCTIDGKVSYADQPCPAGKVTTLAVPVASGDAAAAREALTRDQARLAALQKERGAAEAREARASRDSERAARAAAGRRQKCERLRLKQGWTEQDAARAGGKASEALHLKAKRQGEALAVECPD